MKYYVIGEDKSFKELYESGDVVITSTNTPPTDDTWTLIGKEFEEETFIANAFTGSNKISAQGNSVYASRIGNRITFHGTLTPASSIAANDSLGTFNLSTLGIDTRGFPNTFVFLNHATKTAVYEIKATGEMFMRKVVSDSTSTVGTGKDIDVNFSVDILSNKKLDSACNRFYWMRSE